MLISKAFLYIPYCECATQIITHFTESADECVISYVWVH